jgi:hypothetical protein
MKTEDEPQEGDVQYIDLGENPVQGLYDLLTNEGETEVPKLPEVRHTIQMSEEAQLRLMLLFLNPGVLPEDLSEEPEDALE